MAMRLQDPAKAERRRLLRHAERQAQERAATEDVNRWVEELAEDEIAAVECRSNGYRPDETELFQDLKEEMEWTQSAREYEEFMRWR